MKSQVSCVPSNHMRLSCLRPSQMLCVTVELVGTSLIASTFRLLFALSLAAGGIRMAKAGNRSISSKSGSADVLEALGINVAASPETLSKALDEVGLAFIFAQTMHPAMRFIGPARQALGIPTIMNLVGPLANPLDLETQLMGLYRVELQEIVANAIQQLGRKRAVIITGPDNMDEAALYGTNTYTLLEDGHISQHTFTYEDLGMEKVELSDITGGDAKENAEILLSVLKNEASPYLGNNSA